MSNEQVVQKTPRNKSKVALGAGIIFGLALGFIIGGFVANLAIGIALGVCLGIGLGWLGSRKKKEVEA